MKNRIAAIRITISRPMWSAIRPAISAPAAAPSSAEATAKPSSAASVPNCVVDRRDGAVDDGTVVPEQEPAERGDRRYSDNALALVRVVIDGFTAERRAVLAHGFPFHQRWLQRELSTIAHDPHLESRDDVRHQSCLRWSAGSLHDHDLVSEARHPGSGATAITRMLGPAPRYTVAR